MSSAAAASGSAEARCVVGYMPETMPTLQGTLELSYGARFDFVALALTHGRQSEEGDGPQDVDGPLTRSDRLLSSERWATEVVGCVSTWVAPDSADPDTRELAQRTIKREISWAQHLNLPAILLPTPEFSCLNYARIMCTVMVNAVHAPNVWMQVPLSWPSAALPAMDGAEAAPTTTRGEAALYGGTDALAPRRGDPWEAWNRFRNAVEHCPRVGVAIEVSSDLPSDASLTRWFSEPVKALIIPTSSFLANAKGFPVLPKAHQTFIRRILRAFNPRVIVSGAVMHSAQPPQKKLSTADAAAAPDASAAALACYVQYVHHLHRTTEPLTEQEDFEKGYRDYLQAPLQPLFDNLESQTYETFEKDPIKYLKYEWAVRDALLANSEFSVVMVVGAGRGPLVAATLRAAETVQRKLTVYAVEKNPNAVITLRNRVADDAGWKDVVVVSCDMRFWEAPGGILADILVSELLGSFGDNELSPECLDGAQRFLRLDGGISIPCDYTSFVAPVSTPKLWQQINGMDDKEKLETPYVVRLWNFVQLAPAQPCFKFTHPRWCATRGVGAAGTEGELSDNRRFGAIRFAKQAVSSMVHGFAGFFESTLFDDQMISIHPPTHSPGMFSWFPLYFPLRTPVYVAEGEWVAFHIWRCVDERGAKVWYEWCVETATYTSPIHNPAGRACNIGL